MGLDLSWRADSAADYCLHHSTDAAPLACWQGTTEGAHHTQLSSREDVSYWLQRPQQNTQLARITVRIVSLAKRGPERRRRRHPWSVL